MSWGRSKPQPPPSTLRKLLPLFIVLVVVGCIGWVCYQIYVSATKIRVSAKERMNKKNVVLTRDGMRVGVKSIKNEKYVDKTQSWVVKAWRAAQPGGDDGDVAVDKNQ